MGHQRDEEMTQFIAEFELTRSSTISDQQTTQDTIVALLEHISSSLAAEQDMPTQQRLKEMKEEATFKEKQLESSQQTMQRLQNERKQRPAEMEKIKNLDEKIQIELGSLTSKIEGMKKELQASETWKKLQALEMKLRTYAQTIFALQEYVETKGRETDFESIKENCNSIVDKLNKEAKERSIAGPSIGTMRPAM